MKNKTILFKTILFAGILFSSLILAGNAAAVNFTLPPCHAYNTSGSIITHAYPGETVYFSTSDYIHNGADPLTYSYIGSCTQTFSNTGSDWPSSCYTSNPTDASETLTVTDSTPTAEQESCPLTVDDPLEVTCSVSPNTITLGSAQNVVYTADVTGGHANTFAWANTYNGDCTQAQYLSSGGAVCTLPANYFSMIGPQVARVTVTSDDGQIAYADCSLQVNSPGTFYTVDYSLSLTMPPGSLTDASNRINDSFYYQLVTDDGTVVDQVYDSNYVTNGLPDVQHMFELPAGVTGSLHARIKIPKALVTDAADKDCGHVTNTCTVPVGSTSTSGTQPSCCELGTSFYNKQFGLCSGLAYRPSCSSLTPTAGGCQDGVPGAPYCALDYYPCTGQGCTPTPYCKDVYSQNYPVYPGPDECAYNHGCSLAGGCSCDGTNYLAIGCDSHADDIWNYLYSGQSYNGLAVNITASRGPLNLSCKSGIYNSGSGTVTSCNPTSCQSKAGVDTLGFQPNITGASYDPFTTDLNYMTCDSRTGGICKYKNPSPGLFSQYYFWLRPTNEGAPTYGPGIYYNGTTINDPAVTCPAVDSVWPPVSVSCSSSPNPVYTGQTLNFNASASGGSGSYNYLWLNTDDSQDTQCGNTYNSTCAISYVTATPYSKKVIVGSGSMPYFQSGTATCSPVTPIVPPAASKFTICGHTTSIYYCPPGSSNTTTTRTVTAYNAASPLSALFDVGPISQQNGIFTPYTYTWACGPNTANTSNCNGCNGPTCMITSKETVTGTVYYNDFFVTIKDSKGGTADSAKVYFPYKITASGALGAACSTIVAGTTSNPSCSATVPVAVASKYGQTISLIVTPSGGTTPYTYSWTGTDNGSTANSICGGGSATYTGGGTCTESSTALGSDTRTVTITSNDGQSTKIVFNLTVAQGTATVTASDDEMVAGDSPPEITATYSPTLISPHPTTPATCTTTATAGSGPGTYPSTCSGASDANYTFTYVSGTVTVIPSKPTAYCDPPWQQVMAGQQATITGGATGGHPDYTYKWTGDCGNPDPTDPSCTKTYIGGNPKTRTIYLLVTDGYDRLSAPPNTYCQVYVESQPGGGDIGSPCVPPGNCIPPETCTGSPPVCTGTLSASCSVSPASGSSPLAVKYFSNVSGGNGTYTYTWTADAGTPNSCSGTGKTCSKTYTNATGAPISETSKLVVHSGTQTSAPSSCTATVNPAPASNPVVIASCNSNPNPVSVNETTTFQPVGVSGGTPPYMYAWTDDADNSVSSQNFSVSYASATPPTHTATVTVIDTDGKSASASCPVTITQPITIGGCISDPSSVPVNATTTFKPVGVSGGTGSYSYSWTDDAGHSGSSQNFPVTYASATPSTHTATIVVTDMGNGSFVSASCLVTVGQLQPYGCNGDKCQLGGTGNPCTVATQATDCSAQNQPTCLTYNQKCSAHGDGWVSCTLDTAGDALCAGQSYGCNGDKCQLGGTGNPCTVATQATDCSAQNQPTCNTSTQTCIHGGDSNISCIIGSPTQGDSYCSNQSYGCNGEECQLGGTGNPCTVATQATDCSPINQATCDSSKVCMARGDSNISCIPGTTGTAYCASQPPTPTQVDSTPPNQPLISSPLTAQTFSQGYCGYGSGAGGVFFAWTYLNTSNNPETRFQFQVEDKATVDADGGAFNSPEISSDVSGTNASGNSQFASVVISPASNSNQLAYNTAYYWRVKVYDNTGLDSGWVRAVPFTTATHAYPYSSFVPSPASAPLISGHADIDFNDASQCYTTGIATPYGCSTGASNTYFWNFGNGKTGNTKGSTSNSYTAANTNPGYTATLKVCDELNDCCTSSNTVRIGTPPNIPQWKEVSPF